MTRSHEDQTLFIGLPAYNEEPSIIPLLERLASLVTQVPNIEVVLFDDGSTDETVSVFSENSDRFKTHILQAPSNQGLGNAVREIMNYFLRNSESNDGLVLMDCDNTHDPLQVIDMLSSLHDSDKDIDIVVASRYVPGAVVMGVPKMRELLSLCFSLVCRGLFPMPETRDYSCGFRYYSRSSVHRLSEVTMGSITAHDGFVAMPEILLRLRALGYRATEIPIVLRYDQKKSSSKMPALQNSIRLSLNLVAWRLGIGMP